ALRAGYGAATVREALNASWTLSLGDWLPTLGLTQAQWEGMLLPWAASIFTGDIDQARGFSARAAMVFAAKALPNNPLDPIVYYVLNQGMIAALERMAAQFTTVHVLTGAPVTGVNRVLLGSVEMHYSYSRDRNESV